MRILAAYVFGILFAIFVGMETVQFVNQTMSTGTKLFQQR